MRLTAINSGFRVKDGELEIFPNTKTYNPKKPTNYKAHRLPLQPESGSFLLDDDLQPESDSIEKFLDLADMASLGQDIELIEGAAISAYQTRKSRSFAPLSIKAEEFERDLLEQLTDGWSDYGQTNDLLRVIGTYGRIFKKVGDRPLSLPELTEYIATTAQKLPNYRKYCRHQHNINQRAADWARCVAKFYYPYGSEPNREGRFPTVRPKVEVAGLPPAGRPPATVQKENVVNGSRAHQAVERLQSAYDHLIATLGTLPQRIEQLKTLIIETSQKLFGIRPSDRTLNKHRSIWHPQHQPTPPQATDNSQPTASASHHLTNPENPEATRDEEQKENLHREDRSPTPVPAPSLAPQSNTPQIETHQKTRSTSTPGICHTPLDVVRKLASNIPTSQPIPDNNFSQSATPPLYMKVAEAFSPSESASSPGVVVVSPKAMHQPNQIESHKNQNQNNNNNSRQLDKPSLSVETGRKPLKTDKRNLSYLLHPQLYRSVIEASSRILCQTIEVIQPPSQPLIEAEPSAQSTNLQSDFLTWYGNVRKTDDGVLDVPHRYLPTDRNNQPLVRIGRPDPWLKIPYTLLPWREAMAEFPLLDLAPDPPG
ncbi:hypothetical protein C7B64_09915 [Merismopedia glauca CCAP 1448/3]|uniref:Uncharacterized protein n=1 Tax=Merismopedia glauca CCAP 1448/3 TaxID=1296344 RepID=A0A2T1C4D7_9CYAN|nr:hypothetical protein C7B64_09915 [Merismopedia glauca CCAP 1448/3]